MTIELTALIVTVVFIATSLIAKGLERRRDVLYGPYIEGRQEARRPLEAISDPLAQVISGLRPNAVQLAWKMRDVSRLESAING